MIVSEKQVISSLTCTEDEGCSVWFEPDGTEHHLARHTEMPVEISGPGTGIVGINYRVDAIPDDLDESKLET